jgi:hypothetical protein
MPNGDLSDITVSNLTNCIYTGCGSSPVCPSSGATTTVSKTIDEIVKNYRACHTPVAGNNPTPATEKYFIADMSAAYVTYMNALQGVKTALSDVSNNIAIQTARNQLDKDLINIYKLDKGALSEYKTHYESTLISGLMWGTLAATITYYVLYS